MNLVGHYSSSKGLVAALSSGFEKVAANLGIDVIAAKATLRENFDHLFNVEPDSRLVVTRRTSTKQPGADLDLKS